ncbi:UNVERIFIED_CONTAM: hypothetical protein PYX00_007106 [Menopon gallinae]
MNEASKWTRTVPETTPDDLFETQLSCVPDPVTFENCEMNKTYVQTYKLTNIGLDVIHVSYIGIELMDADEGLRVPLRVDIHDNHLLRPGISFVAKVRLSPVCEVPEFHCYLLYETRKKKHPNKHFYFRVHVACYPPKPIIDVSPAVIRFPTVTWCVIKGPERLKYMRKTLKITNSGHKDCFCSIWNPVLDGLDIEIDSDVFSAESYNPCEGSEECRDSHAYYEAEKIVDELICNVFEIFRFSWKYHIPVPAMSTITLDVDFFPDYRGYHQSVVYVRTEDAPICTEKKVELIGNIKKIPLLVEPASLDLKVCTINSGVYESTFRIYNVGNGPVHVRVKVPGSMKNHALVFPTAPIIQAGSFQTCSIRLFPRFSIAKEAYRYYKEDIRLLEFPIFITPVSSDSCTADRIKLYVFAILTDYALEVNPAEIDFGSVSTIETVKTQISLTNHSIVPQEFGFLRLPMGVRIEPNNGFGTILPKETIMLYLLFSPIPNCESPIEYNFEIKVTTLFELSGFGERPATTDTVISTSNWGEDLIYNTEAEQTSDDSGSVEKSDSTEEGAEKEDEDDDDFWADSVDEVKILEEKQQKIREYLKQSLEPAPVGKCTDSGECSGEWPTEFPPRKKMQIIMCKATVYKPHCQLSSTVIQLPATPISSFSLTRLWLNGLISNNFNNPYCENNEEGGMDELALFEFRTTSPIIEIEPTSGCIARGQSVPITIICKPDISKEKLCFQSKVIQAEKMLDDENKSIELPPQKSKSKTKNKPAGQPPVVQKIEVESHDVNLSNMEVNTTTMFSSERILQQITEPTSHKINVSCVIKKLSPTERLYCTEYHNLILIAPVIKPSFIYLGNCQEIRFGKVAVGDQGRKIIEIQNTSLKRIPLQISALNPAGSYWCTTGWRMSQIDPEHIWKHPITYTPAAENGKEVEFFEIRQGATIVNFTVNGEGIMPKCTFTPDFALCLLETEKDAEMELGIENICTAPVRLQMISRPTKLSYTFKGDPYFTEGTELKIQDPLTKKNGKKTARSEVKTQDASLKKNVKKTTQTTKEGTKRIVLRTEVPPEITLQLENDFNDVEIMTSDLFTITGLDSNNTLIIDPSAKGLLKIKFDLNMSKKEGENGPIPSAFSITYTIMVANAIVIKELTIIVCITN